MLEKMFALTNNTELIIERIIQFELKMPIGTQKASILMFIFIPFYQAFSDLYVKQNYAEGNVNFTLIEENALFLFTSNKSIILIWVFVMLSKKLDFLVFYMRHSLTNAC